MEIKTFIKGLNNTKSKTGLINKHRRMGRYLKSSMINLGEYAEGVSIWNLDDS